MRTDATKCMLQEEVIINVGGHKIRGAIPKKRWIDCLKHDMNVMMNGGRKRHIAPHIKRHKGRRMMMMMPDS